MPVEPGQTLLHYRIVDKLGEGGMGVVWKAVDTTLDRDVAIKILPREFADDTERLARFEREAKLLASLNHPHIAAVYGLHQASTDDGPVRILAMELVEGEDLQRQLERGPMPVDQALDIAVQIAAGVEAAHEKGVVHRDLKPANVVRSPEGNVKVLDFGLAKSFLGERGATSGSADLAMSPTMTSVGSIQGVILGTASYMSPEQARGRIVDQRTDVWAFGCVLFELLSGVKPFGGDTLTDVLAAIVRAEPDWDALAGRVPENVIALIKRCLRKDPRERLRSVGDIGLTLKELGAESMDAALPASAGRRGLSPMLTAALVLGVAVVAAGLASWFSRSEPVVEPQLRFSIQLPDDTFMPAGVGTTVVVSRDGSRIVYLAEDLEERRLYVRDTNDFESRPLPGTEGSANHFISPDGEWVGFSNDTGIWKISLSSLEIYPLHEYRGWASWGDDGYVIFTRDDGLWRVPETGGEPEMLAEPKPDMGISRIVRPTVLPGNKAVLFEIGDAGFGGVGVVSLESGQILTVSTNGSDPFYSPTGHIVFGRENMLFAVPFDLERLEITGRETHVLQGVRVENAGALQADLSENGMLVYAPSGATMGTQLTWVDRQGKTEAVNDQWRPYTRPSVSPNGERIAAVVNDGGRTDVWIVDVASGGMARLTTSGNASAPAWTPDGGAITFVEGTPPSFTIRTVPVESSGQVETLLTSEHQMSVVSWHPDGNLLIFLEKRGGMGNLFVLDVSAGTRTALLAPDLNISAASLSPDGRRLAYSSNKTGRSEVYVGPFPGPGAEVLVSVDGGTDPIWSPDGSEIVYRDSRRFSMAKLDDLRVSDRGPLIDAVHFWGGGDIHPQTERFLVLHKNDDQLRPGIHVVLNWFDELNRAAPAN